MDDVARMGLEIDADSVRVANDNMRAFVQQASASERAAQRWNASSRSAASQTNALSGSVAKLGAAFNVSGTAAIVQAKAVDVYRFAVTKLFAVIAAFQLGKNLITSAIDVSGLQESAEQVGLTARALQALQFGAAQAGVGVSELNSGIAKFSRTIGDAAEGNKQALDSLNKLNVKIMDARGNLRPTEDVLTDVAAAIMSIDDPARRAAAAVDFFGKSGTRYLPLLASIAQGFTKIGAEAQNAGAMASDELIAKLDAVADKLERFKLTAKVAFAEVAGWMVDQSEKAQGWFDKAFPPDARSLEARKNAWLVPLQDFFDDLSGLLQDASATFQGWIAGLGSIFGSLRVIIGNAFANAMNDAIGYVEQGINTVREALSTLSERAKSNFKGTPYGPPNPADRTTLPRMGTVESANPMGGILADAKAQSDAARQAALSAMNSAKDARARQRELERQTAMQGDDANARRIPLGQVNPPGKTNPPPSKDGGGGKTDPYAKAIESAQDYIATKKAETEAIGKSVFEAAKLKHSQDLLNKATADGAKVSETQEKALNAQAEAMARADEAFASAKFLDDFKTKTEQVIEAQKIEQETLFMSTEAAMAYKIAQEEINDAKRKGIVLSDEAIAKIKEQAAAQAQITTQVEETKKTIEFAKGTVKDFFSDFKQGIMDGKSFWESFGTAALNVLDKIANKLMEMALDDLLQGALGGGMGNKTSGFFDVIGSILGGIGGGVGAGSGTIFAKGAAFRGGNVIPFARGGLVNSPTAFPMSGGRTGLMGEKGEEAIMPLSKGPGGELGVRAHGGRDRGASATVIRLEVSGDNEWVRVIARDESNNELARAEPRIVGKAVRQSTALAPAAVAARPMKREGEWRTNGA